MFINIAILIEKFCDLNPAFGETSAVSDIVGSAISSGIVTPFVFHYDDFLINHGVPINDFLFDNLRQNNYKALVVSYYPFENDSRNVSLDFFNKVKNELKIPIIFMWFDFAHSHIKNLAIKLSEFSDLNLVIDSINVPEKFMSMWSPRDENVFKFSDSKDINICFNGSMNGYNERHRYIDFLKGHVEVYISGGQREHALSIDQYANVFRRSKISLNFPAKQDESIVQVKGRVFESMMCGCLLLEKDNDIIKNWFEPMIHYVPFSNPFDLLNKINYYLNNEEERVKIAMAGYEKMKKDYSAKNWWERILNGAKT